MHSSRLRLVSVPALLLLLVPSALEANDKCRYFFEWTLEDAEIKAEAEGIPYSVHEPSEGLQDYTMFVCPGDNPDNQMFSFYATPQNGQHWLKSREVASTTSSPDDPVPYVRWMQAVAERCPQPDSCSVEGSQPQPKPGIMIWSVTVKTKVLPHAWKDYAYVQHEIDFISTQTESGSTNSYNRTENYLWRFPDQV